MLNPTLKAIDRIISILCCALAKTFLSKAWRDLQGEAALIHHRSYSNEYRRQLGEVARALVAAEDRRFYSHYGIDTRSMVRAAWLFITKGRLQGASTITQQLVRVLTRRYDRTLRRKLREVLLASLLDRDLPKEEQIFCYLKVAYFGWRMNGVTQALQRLRYSIPLTPAQAAQIVARLKFPEPKVASPALRGKILARARHIEDLLSYRPGRY